MKQLNYKPIGSVLLSLFSVVKSDSELFVCDSKGNRCKNSSMDRNGCCRICGEDIAN